MHYKSFIFSSLIIMISTFSVAQNIDHIYLKSGSVIRGQIKELNPMENVKVLDLCGNLWNYKMSEVEKITNEPYEQVTKFKSSYNFSTGFVNMTSIGFLIGSPGNEQVAPFSFLTVNGWQHSMGLFTGIGTGFELFKTTYLPLFADIRYDLTEGDVVPYMMAKGGYTFPLSPNQSEYEITYEYHGGFTGGVGAGIKIKTRKNFAWDISVLYRYISVSYMEKFDYNNTENNYTDIYNRFELRVGFYID